MYYFEVLNLNSYSYSKIVIVRYFHLKNKKDFNASSFLNVFSSSLRQSLIFGIIITEAVWSLRSSLIRKKERKKKKGDWLNRVVCSSINVREGWSKTHRIRREFFLFSPIMYAMPLLYCFWSQNAVTKLTHIKYK